MPHDTEDMIQLLLNTNKEQEQTIVDLRATIKELRSTIANLNETIDELKRRSLEHPAKRPGVLIRRKESRRKKR